MKRRGRPGAEASTTSKVVSTAIANLALPATAIVTGPILARALAPEGRGDVAAVITPLLFASYLFTLGIPQAISYRVASGAVDARRMVGPAIVLGLVSGAVGAAALLAFIPILFATKQHLVPLASALVLVLPAVLVFAAVRAVYQGTSDFFRVNRERWVSVLLRFGAVVVMAILGLLTVDTVAWSSQLALIGGGITLFWGLRHVRNRREAVAQARVYGPVLSYGSRVWVGTLSSLLIIRLDQVLMVPLTTSAQLGFYAVAVAVAEVPTAAFAALRDVIFARATDADGPEVVGVAARLVTVAFIPATVAYCLAAPWLVPLAFGQDFAQAVIMSQILWVAALPAGLAGVFGAAILGLGRPGVFSAVQLVIAGANSVMMVLLVPPLGGLGAAIASGSSYLVFALAGAVLLARYSSTSVRALLLPRRSDVALLRSVVLKRSRPA